MSPKYRLLAFFPHSISTYGVGYAALAIMAAMNSDKLECVLAVPTTDIEVQSEVINRLIPSVFVRILYKLFPIKIVRKITEFLFLTKIKPCDIVYLWPGVSMALFRKIKAKGNIIIIENINCHQKVSKQILDNEIKQLCLQKTHLITQVSVENESEKLKFCNYVFSPSPLVTKSLLDTGVASEKILESSYGLHEYQQLDINMETLRTKKPLEVIFVGRVGLRKGIHLILEYWQAANINGTLKIIGNIEESIKSLIEPYRNIDNIQFIDFVSDIEKAYKSADIFVLPSLEEGSPLVTYLALGAGLPCIVSPMGGQGVVTHNRDGFIIEPHDKISWINALQKLANSPELLLSQSQAARKSSDRFLWKNVGRQRAALLLDKLQGI